MTYVLLLGHPRLCQAPKQEFMFSFIVQYPYLNKNSIKYTVTIVSVSKNNL